MADKKTELSVEQALERIEALVQEMEEGKLPLEDVIARFEEGSELVKSCQKKLSLAEERIKIILRNAEGPTGLDDFESARE
jgi:exodeoxyribonuclease VII small subunit